MPGSLIGIKQETNSPFLPQRFIQPLKSAYFARRTTSPLIVYPLRNQRLDELTQAKWQVFCVFENWVYIYISLNCQSRVKCFNCGGRHHVTNLLKPENVLQSQNSVPQAASPNGSGSLQGRIRDVGTREQQHCT